MTAAGARAITPDAIPRQTAWLPAVRCSESTASVASGAPTATAEPQPAAPPRELCFVLCGHRPTEAGRWPKRLQGVVVDSVNVTVAL